MEYSPELRGKKSDLFQIFWVVVFVSSSLYSFTWDVFMDWGLGRREYGFLGPSLMYPRRYYYFAVIAIDLGTSWLSSFRFPRIPQTVSHPRLLVSSPPLHVGVDPCPSFFWGSLRGSILFDCGHYDAGTVSSHRVGLFPIGKWTSIKRSRLSPGGLCPFALQYRSSTWVQGQEKRNWSRRTARGDPHRLGRRRRLRLECYCGPNGESRVVVSALGALRGWSTRNGVD